MKKYFIVFQITLYATYLYSNECWSISNAKGFSAFSNENYKFEKNGLPKEIIVCFGEENGMVSGTDMKLLKFGNSTLAGFSESVGGMETFEVYQLDRLNKKLLYTKSRIGTKSDNPLLPDVVSAFVGDAAPYKGKK